MQENNKIIKELKRNFMYIIYVHINVYVCVFVYTTAKTSLLSGSERIGSISAKLVLT